jgi:hypothetical protein
MCDTGKEERHSFEKASRLNSRKDAKMSFTTKLHDRFQTAAATIVLLDGRHDEQPSKELNTETRKVK